MRPCHQNFRFYNRDYTLFLAYGSIPCKGMCIYWDCSGTWKISWYLDDGSPFGKSCAHAIVFFASAPQSIKTLSDGLSFVPWKWFCPRIHLYPWNNSLRNQVIGNRSTVIHFLSYCLIKQYHSWNVLLDSFWWKHSRSICPASVLARFHIHGFQSFWHCTVAFIGC